jgi:parallel beta-helix repeat protein
MITLTHDIQLAKAYGTVYIRADGSVDPSTTPIQHVGNTYTMTGNIYDAIIIEKSNIVLDGAEYAIQGIEVFYSKGIYLFSTSNVTIKNTNIRGFTFGIYFNSSTYCAIFRNNITNNGHAIEFWYSSNNSILENNMTDNLGGTYFIESSYNNISENNVKDNQGGLLIGYSTYNSISNNRIENNIEGIRIWHSSYNTCYRNNVSYNEDGVKIWNFADYNNILENNITGSRHDGIILSRSFGNRIFGNDIVSSEEGIYVYNSSGTLTYNNNFINNTQQVNNVDSINSWNDYYPYCGNYWSDYSGKDLNWGSNQDKPGSDGIGDIEYTIDVENRDHYPLMEAWAWPSIPKGIGDVNRDGKVNIYDIVLVAVAYGSRIGDYNWNGNADFAPLFGVINIYDVTTIASNYGKTYS